MSGKKRVLLYTPFLNHAVQGFFPILSRAFDTSLLISRASPIFWRRCPCGAARRR